MKYSKLTTAGDCIHKYPILEKAICVAKAEFIGRTRKFSTLPLVTHSIATMEILHRVGITDEETLCAAILHDVLEDSTAPEEDLIKCITRDFGEKVCSLVLELTTPRNLHGKEALEYQCRKAESLTKEAALVKVADKLANMLEIKEQLDEITSFYEYYSAKSLRVIESIPECYFEEDKMILMQNDYLNLLKEIDNA
jgi:(p)ppGpp synthase/HD superfamily hydrolase